MRRDRVFAMIRDLAMAGIVVDRQLRRRENGVHDTTIYKLAIVPRTCTTPDTAGRDHVVPLRGTTGSTAERDGVVPVARSGNRTSNKSKEQSDDVAQLRETRGLDPEIEAITQHLVTQGLARGHVFDLARYHPDVARLWANVDVKLIKGARSALAVANARLRDGQAPDQEWSPSRTRASVSGWKDVNGNDF